MLDLDNPYCATREEALLKIAGREQQFKDKIRADTKDTLHHVRAQLAEASAALFNAQTRFDRLQESEIRLTALLERSKL